MADDPCDPALARTVAASQPQALYGEELAAGALIGAYVIERVHHRGVQATLYKAAHARDGRPAAVKLLSAVHSTRALQRFEQEAAALNRLRHPHIVEIYEHGALRDGRPFFAMAWIDGRDLHEELRARGPLSPAETAAMVEQVGAALAAAHAVGIVHRDLKAQNIMAAPRGRWLHLTLVDFGVAKFLEVDGGRAASLTSTGLVIGTPLVMAPEQLRGEPIDARVDIYALGVLLFQSLTGRPPFVTETVAEVEQMHLSARPPRPGDLAPMPPQLDELVLRCLEKRPELRFASVAELLPALRAAVAGGPAPVRSSRRLGLLVIIAVDPVPDPAPDPALYDPGDAVLDDLEAVLELARRACLDEQLDVAVTGSGALLATAPLPGEPDGERRARRRLLRWALALAARLAARPGRQAAVRVALSVDASDGAALHELGAIAAVVDGAVTVTAAACQGLDGLGLAAIAGDARVMRLHAVPEVTGS